MIANFISSTSSNKVALKSQNSLIAPSKLIAYLQLIRYETAPNFIQLTQNLTSDCLFFGMQFCIRMAKKDFQHYCHSHSAAIKTLPTLTKWCYLRMVLHTPTFDWSIYLYLFIIQTFYPKKAQNISVLCYDISTKSDNLR